MNIIEYTESHFSALFELIHSTIQDIYPLYYPEKVAEFFHNHHSETSLKEDLTKSRTLLLLQDDLLLATGAIANNEIKRVFVSPVHQGQGMGKALMTQLEQIARQEGQSSITLSSTLAAYDFYLHLDYIFSKYNIMEIGEKRKLCYFTMDKEL